MKLGGHDVLNKKMKVKFDTTTHCSEGLLDCVYISILGLTMTASLESHQYYVSFFDNLSRYY